MRPAPFEYYAPTSVEEALRLLSEKEGAKLLAGGQSLLALMKLRLLAPPALIDLNRIKELRYVREENGWVLIGAMTLYDELEQSPLIRSRYPALHEALYRLGDQQVRNRGTIGGSLAHADPSANLPPVMVALKAELVAAGPGGRRRTIPAEEFFLDAFTTALEPEREMLVEVRLPPWPRGSGGTYMKLSKREIDFSIVEVAVQMTVDGGGRVSDARVVLGSVAPKPYRAVGAERAILGSTVDGALAASAAEEGVRDLEPPSDVQASSWYRKEVAKVLVKRAILKAYERARGVVG
ncbi:MAG: FAD binding domain-containing protein [Conexivisphaera sp.]